MTQQTIADCYRSEIADLRQQVEIQRSTNDQLCDLSERLRKELAEKMDENDRLRELLKLKEANA